MDIRNKIARYLPLKLPLALLLASQFVCGMANAASVNCDDSPHTKLEAAICSAPALQALDAELSAALSLAVDRNVLAPAAAAELRNGVAKLCWREEDAKLKSCLMSAELHSYQWVLGQMNKFGVLHTSRLSQQRFQYKRIESVSVHDHFMLLASDWKSADGLLVHNVQQLKKQLAFAERSFSHTRKTDFTVATIAALLDALRDQRNTVTDARNITVAITNLERRALRGCYDSRINKKWRASLQNYGLSCEGLDQQVASTDFD